MSLPRISFGLEGQLLTSPKSSTASNFKTHSPWFLNLLSNHFNQDSICSRQTMNISSRLVELARKLALGVQRVNPQCRHKVVLKI